MHMGVCDLPLPTDCPVVLATKTLLVVGGGGGGILGPSDWIHELFMKRDIP